VCFAAQDEERLVSLLTRKIKALTRERDEALRRSSASPRTPLSSRKSSSLRSTPSPSTPGGGARVSLPTLEEGSEAAVGEASSVGDGGEEGRANGDDDVVLTPSLMVHDGAFQDAAGPFSTPETMRYALDVTPKVLNSGEEGEGGGEGEEHAQGAAAGDDKHEEAVNGPSLCHTQERALSVSPACARSPAASPCEGDDQGIFPPFHRFFSEPDFDSSFKAWVRMQSMHHVQDTVPEAVRCESRTSFAGALHGVLHTVVLTFNHDIHVRFVARCSVSRGLALFLTDGCMREQSHLVTSANGTWSLTRDT
jgi:hypothetical protein